MTTTRLRPNFTANRGLRSAGADAPANSLRTSCHHKQLTSSNIARRILKDSERLLSRGITCDFVARASSMADPIKTEAHRKGRGNAFLVDMKSERWSF